MKEAKKYFKNRHDAAEQLIALLPIEKMKKESWIVLSTSSGGTPVAYEVAKKLNAEFDFLFSSKIFAPNNDECDEE